VRALVETEHGVYTVDLETEEVEGLEQGARLEVNEPVRTGLPRVVAAAAAGSTVVAVVKTRPPLAVSHDAGRTWHQAGSGLPPGRGVAIDVDDPDLVVYAARNRLFVSRNGGVFWSALAPELPEIRALALE
jgi:hypothetical protein